MTSIEIHVMQNGYLAKEAASQDNPLALGPRYVFNDWADLARWAHKNLDKPLESVADLRVSDIQKETFAERIARMEHI